MRSPSRAAQPGTAPGSTACTRTETRAPSPSRASTHRTARSETSGPSRGPASRARSGSSHAHPRRARSGAAGRTLRWRRLLLTFLPVVVVFFAWDAYAIAQGHWWFDTDRILGLYAPGSVPLDEILFFITIPLASVLTLEAVRSVRGWPAGDEAPAPPAGEPAP